MAKENNSNQHSLMYEYAKIGAIICSPLLWIAYGLRHFEVPGFTADATIKQPQGAGMFAMWVIAALVTPYFLVGMLVGGAVGFFAKLYTDYKAKKGYEKMPGENDDSGLAGDDGNQGPAPFTSSTPVQQAPPPGVPIPAPITEGTSDGSPYQSIPDPTKVDKGEEEDGLRRRNVSGSTSPG